MCLPERFGVMTHVYYREATAACIVFDVTSRRTFEAVEKWKNDVDIKVHLPNGEPVPCILLANKVPHRRSAFFLVVITFVTDCYRRCSAI